MSQKLIFTGFVVCLALISRNWLRELDKERFARRFDSLANEITYFVFSYQEYENDWGMNRLHALVSTTRENLRKMNPDLAFVVFGDKSEREMIRYLDQKFRDNQGVSSFYVSYLILVKELGERFHPIKNFFLKKMGHYPAFVAACYFQSI